jgi:glucokinase
VIGPRGAPLALAEHIGAWWPGGRVTILNDVTAAGYRHLHATGERDFCIVTVGSGIGHKVFVDGHPVVGPGGRGGELGHLQVDGAPDSASCDCGGRGHLGAIASGRGAHWLLARAAVRDPAGAAFALGCSPGATVDQDRVATAFRAGDAWVTAALQPGIEHLGRALAAVHLAVGTEHFVLVGGLALALGDRYATLVAQAAARSCWDLGEQWTEMVRCGAGDDDHGMIGVGLLAAGLVSP